mgnify:CR=1 FL=1
MRTESEIREMLPEVNDIFEQVGMTFYIDSVVVTNVDGACQPVFDGPARPYNLSFDDVANILPDAGGLKCYFVDSFIDFKRTRAGNDDCGMLLTKQADAISWAHEIGHACGLEDIYDENHPYEFPEKMELTHKASEYLEPSPVANKYYLGQKGFEWVTNKEKNKKLIGNFYSLNIFY